MKARQQKIVCLTAYDASFSALLDRAEIDVMLVGDSLGMVIQGESSTIPVTVADMVYHTKLVSRVRKRAFVIADLPFLSYAEPQAAINNAALLMQQGGAQMVKIEGGRCDIIRLLVDQGVPVCGHLGLLPQSINRLGKYKVQGKEQAQADRMTEDAKKIEDAGADILVLECVPTKLAAKITAALRIPVIGIGAGVDCDGQVLVLYDMLGISSNVSPKFCKNYMQQCDDIFGAVQCYAKEVRQGMFPGVEHSY